MERNIDRIIKAAEACLCLAPPGFAAAVMASLPAVPVLSRKLCAAVCFSSAAAIVLFMITQNLLGERLLP